MGNSIKNGMTKLSSAASILKSQDYGSALRKEEGVDFFDSEYKLTYLNMVPISFCCILPSKHHTFIAHIYDMLHDNQSIEHISAEELSWDISLLRAWPEYKC
jgi:hypothetical protein